MAIKRYVAMTNREAIAQVRRDLGDDAVILSNKRIAGGRIEIVAAAPAAMEALVEDARASRAASATPQVARGTSPLPGESFQEFIRRQSAPAAAPAMAPAHRTARAAQPAARTAAAAARPQPALAMYSDVAAAAPAGDDDAWGRPAWEDDPTDAMPAQAPASPAAVAAVASATNVLQPGRVLHPVASAAAVGAPTAAAPAVFRRRPVRMPGEMAPLTPTAPASASASATAPVMPPVQATPAAPVGSVAPAAPAMSSTAAAAGAPAAVAPVAAVLPPIVVPAPAADQRLLAELASLRTALQEQLASLSSSVAVAQANESQRRNPQQARLLTRLLTSGFTPEVARRVAAHLPPGLDAATAEAWLQDVLALNLRCATEAEGMVETGGVFALVGPTGVGKTTTVAKLAARFAVKYGTSALGLITLDAYRVAAHEQLRTYGRILGAPVHLAQDGATLRELLASMQGRRLVLIDTCGVGPRDARLNEMLATLEQAGQGARRVQPVLLMNAASHAETLDDTARAWRAPLAAGCIFTKLDEAARIGGALDNAMRHKLTLLGLTNGQRVPEDWHAPNAPLLAHLALKPAGQSFALDDAEGALLGQTG